ncbi:MAG: peptidyl-prolyl cis-trans isomerase, partial [Desulfuromonadales bacterium]
MNYLKIILKEPLVHFLLIGAGLFLIYSFSSGPADDNAKRIVVSSGQVEQMVSRFTQTWMRPPLDEEYDGLIKNYVRDEIFYREAVAMGLDLNDQTIKQRLRMKLEFLLEDLSS